MNRLVYQVETITKVQRLEVLQKLLNEGLKWHNLLRYSTALEIEYDYPFSLWPVVTISPCKSSMSGRRWLNKFDDKTLQCTDLDYLCDTFKRMKTGEIE